MNKYSDYYQDVGHSTHNYKPLKFFIEKLMRDGYLMEYCPPLTSYSAKYPRAEQFLKVYSYIGL